MKAKLLLFVMLVALTFSVKAQTNDDTPFKIGVGAMIGLPVGDFGDMASLAYGFDLMGEYAVAPSVALTLSIGYVDFSKKSEWKDLEDELNTKLKLGMIPVLAGAKFYFSDQIYGSAQIGLSFGTESGSGSTFTFAPGVGYKISENLDLLLKYQSATKNDADKSFLGLRLGYTF